MSETVQQKGKLRLIPRAEDLSDLGYAWKVMRQFGKELDEPTFQKEGFEEYLSWKMDYESHYIKDGLVYEIVDLGNFEDSDDIFIVKPLENNEYSFHVKYYNGGCSLDEALEEGFKNLEKETL